MRRLTTIATLLAVLFLAATCQAQIPTIHDEILTAEAHWNEVSTEWDDAWSQVWQGMPMYFNIVAALDDAWEPNFQDPITGETIGAGHLRDAEKDLDAAAVHIALGNEGIARNYLSAAYVNMGLAGGDIDAAVAWINGE